MDDVIVENNKIVATGLGESIRAGKTFSFVSACDVYQFNDKNFLECLSSYCKPDQK